MTDISALPCIVCGKALPGIDHTCNHPSGGTEFVAQGHYGSTVHDPMDGTKLSISVCDPCLLLALANLRVGTYQRGAGGTRSSYVPPK